MFANGEYYEGNFKGNHRNGSGIHYYANRDYYEGEWMNDKRIGRGRIFLAGGGKFNGMFIEDKIDGFVEYEDKDGNVKKKVCVILKVTNDVDTVSYHTTERNSNTRISALMKWFSVKMISTSYDELKDETCLKAKLRE